MPNPAKIIKLHVKTKNKLIKLKKDAEKIGEYRIAKRIHAVVLNAENHSSPIVARLLKVPRSCVSEWLKNYESYGYEALLEGHRSGRPAQLTEEEKIELAGIIDSGPSAYGFLSGVWTSIMIGEIIKNEFNVDFHPGHIRKILQQMNYSMQKPKRVLARANENHKNHWRRYTYPHIKKKRMN